MEELVQPYTVLQRPRACFGVPNDGEREFVCRNENAIYALVAGTTRNREASSSLVQGLPSNVTAVFRAFSENFLKDTRSAARPPELYTMRAKIECEWSTRLDRGPTGHLTWLDSDKENERGKGFSHSGVTAAAKKAPSSSDSSLELDFGTMHFP